MMKYAQKASPDPSKKQRQKRKREKWKEKGKWKLFASHAKAIIPALDMRLGIRDYVKF